MSTLLTVVVPAANRDVINAKLVPLNHGETFSAPLASEGAIEPTHYWASMTVTDDQLAKLQVALAEEIVAMPPVMAWFFDVEPDEALATLNLRPFVA
jgi:hypothetical protein